MLALVPTTALPRAVKLLPALTVIAVLTVTGDANVGMALTVRVLLLLLPRVLSLVTVTGAANVEVAFTVNTLVLLLPRTVSLMAVQRPATDSVLANATAAFAAIGALLAKTVAAENLVAALR